MFIKKVKCVGQVPVSSPVLMIHSGPWWEAFSLTQEGIPIIVPYLGKIESSSPQLNHLANLVNCCLYLIRQ